MEFKCPECNGELREYGVICGGGKYTISLECTKCKVHITSPLLPSADHWTVHKKKKKEKKEVFLWNQA